MSLDLLCLAIDQADNARRRIDELKHDLARVEAERDALREVAEAHAHAHGIKHPVFNPEGKRS